MNSDLVSQLLKKHFGFSSFRPNQEKAIEALIQKKDLFTCMPTGGGKSLCYQLAGLLLEGITVVISPLISLMKDQVDSAVEHGIRADYIGSSRSDVENRAIYKKLFHNEIQLLYLSPERILLDGFCDFLTRFPISLFIIDEAHCISEWGVGFRQEYNKLGILKDFFPNVPIGAFTATATQKVQEDIIKKLKLKNPCIIRASFDRPELLYRLVARKGDGFDQIMDAINRHKDEAGIIYIRTQKNCEKMAFRLQKKGIKALPYHGGLSAKERNANQQAFQNGTIQIICATIAFGMGIDKSNVRFVIHAELPASIESYYQETGRAGRDGKEAECLWLFNIGDWKKQQILIENLNKKMKAKGESDEALIESFQRESLNRLYQVVQMGKSSECRRKRLLAHFSEKYLSNNCHHCDICLQETSFIEGAAFAKSFLSLIQATHQRFGKKYLFSILMGNKEDPRITKYEHHKLSLFASGKEQKESFWLSLYDILLAKEWIWIDSSSGYPLLKLTTRGEAFLEGSLFPRKGELLLPINQSLLTSEKKKASSPQSFSNKDPKALNAHLTAEEVALFQELKKRRLKIAHQQQTTAFIIFSDKTLIEMAQRKPKTKTEFLDLYGVGEMKWQKYGKEFIELIKKF